MIIACFLFNERYNKVCLSIAFRCSWIILSCNSVCCNRKSTKKPKIQKKIVSKIKLQEFSLAHFHIFFEAFFSIWKEKVLIRYTNPINHHCKTRLSCVCGK
jgi:hypothetical protein